MPSLDEYKPNCVTVHAIEGDTESFSVDVRGLSFTDILTIFRANSQTVELFFTETFLQKIESVDEEMSNEKFFEIISSLLRELPVSCAR